MALLEWNMFRSLRYTDTRTSDHLRPSKEEKTRKNCLWLDVGKVMRGKKKIYVQVIPQAKHDALARFAYYSLFFFLYDYVRFKHTEKE